MPIYDYLCPACGPFREQRPMAEFDAPYPCEGCGAAAPRALLVAPAMAGMDHGRRTAFATNERSANAPARASRHPAGCGCCAKRSATTLNSDAPASPRIQVGHRPWMLGH